MRKDIKGKKYGMLTAIAFSRYDPKKQKTYWKFICDCGNEVEALVSNVVQGIKTSCGCIKREKSIKNMHMEDGTTIKYNIKNNIIKKNNKTGCTGVSYEMNRGKYYASIYYKGKSYSLGRYEKLSDAITARKIAEEEVLNNRFDEYIEKNKIRK
jgi:hypothetical protein